MHTIQKATPLDALLISDIAARSFVESHGHSAPAEDVESYVATNYALPKVIEELRNDKNIFHTLYFNGKPAGYSKIIFDVPHSLIIEQNVTKLDRLYLLKEFYGLKLGLLIFQFLIELSKQANQEGMWLYVWIKNERAVRFYKNAGFEIIGYGDFKISETHSNPNHIMYLKY